MPLVKTTVEFDVGAMKNSFSKQLGGHSLMMSHKFEDFLTPSLLCHAKMTFLRSPLYIASQKLPPPPPTCVTSFMDDPLKQAGPQLVEYCTSGTIPFPLHRDFPD